MGYHQAGFKVYGVDKKPQPSYPFEFIQGDAVALVPELCAQINPAAVGGSPPCQVFANVTNWRGSNDTHENLVPALRAQFELTGLPWVIENVPEAAAAGALRPDLLLCGSMFGLDVRRHRVFETYPRLLQMTSPCQHTDDQLPFEHKNERAYADAMGCTWMSAKEGRQAIPPAYTQHIGEQLMANLVERAA